jgi:small-conductance mechanosensitive channel
LGRQLVVRDVRDMTSTVTKLHAMAIVVLFQAAIAVGGVAQAQTAPAPTLTREQYDALVDDISKSVVDKLKADGVTPKAASPAKASPFDAASGEEPDEFALFLSQTGRVLEAVPAFGQSLAAFYEALDDSGQGGRGRRTFLLVLGLAVAAALAAESILRGVLGRLRARLAAGAMPERGLRSLNCLGLLALLDGFGVLAVWLVGRAADAFWFSGSTIQDRFAVGLLTGILLWRLYALVFRIILRPRLSPARLCDVQGAEARRMYRLVSAFLLLTILLRMIYYVLVAMDAPADAIAAGRVLLAPFLFAAFVWVVVRSKEGARQWLEGLGRVAPVAHFVGRHWVAVATLFFLALIATLVYGAISGRTGVPIAMILTLNLVAGLLIFETLLQALVMRVDSRLQGFTPDGDREKLADVIARCVRVAVLIGIAVIVAEHWVVDVFDLVDARAWDKLTRASQTAGITLFIAFVLWELFKYAAQSYVDRISRESAGGAAVSRLDTLMPMLRVTIAIVIFVVAILIALEDLGVNVTPLLAGASVLGLAVSFGSQTLVKDIVSGIFYLADDAFRVGEYIDCGKAKGTVEGFTLRSVRLRNQNGQIHTIPFGELGQIANFSRDWTSVKFSLRFARDTDLEKLRTAAKQIGADIMEVPELKAELLEPLKMQGVDDVSESALTIRFKFTARPGNPGAIQNEAITRMLRAFPQLGIEFAK